MYVCCYVSKVIDLQIYKKKAKCEQKYEQFTT